MKKDKSNKAQKPTYLVWGSIVIGLVVILVVYFVMIALGLVQVSKNHIVITTENADKMYDGEELTADGWELADGELLDGHTIEAEVLGTQTEVGESDNIITVTILDSEGADVTSTYEIEYQLGKLTVHGKKLMFYTESAQKYYDGTPLSCDKWGYYEGTLEQLMEGHEFTAHCSGQLTNIGEAENLLMVSVVDTATGEDVTKYYDVVVEKGILKVDPIRLVVSFGTTGSLGPTGGEISTDSVVVSGNLLDGHHVCIEPIETEIAGISANTIFVYVLDADGNDVTEYYEVVYPSGDLTLENPETMLPRLPDNMASTNDYKEMYDEMKDKLPEDGSGDAPTLEDYENLLKESGAADELPPELAALALTPVYTVIAEQNGTVYLRQQSYGDFDGNDWSDPMAYSGVSPYLYSHAALSANGSSSTSVKVKPLFNNLKYVLPYYYESGDTSPTLANDCWYTDELPTVGEYYDTVYIPYTYSYDSLPRTFTAEERSYAEFVYNTYLGVDETTKAELIRLAAEAGICDENGAVIAQDVIAAIAEYIRNAATYNLEFAPIPDGENSVLYFLTQSKEGVCRHFAAAATLMYRSLGLPARYVTGFAANAEAGKEIVVTAMMAHAWVEVYVDGFGWLQMEVTGSDQNGDSGIQDGTGTDGLGGGGGSGGGSGGGTGGGSGSGGGAGGTGGGAGAPGDDGGDELIMSVYSTQTGPLYLREYSWGRFDGVEWLPVDDENIYHGSDPFATVVSALDGNSKAKISQLKVKMMAENMPYVLTYYANEYASTSANDCYVNGTYELEETYNVNYIYYDYITSGHITNADYTVDKDYYENYVACDGSIYLEVAQRTLDGYEVDGVRRAGLKEILESLGIEGKSLYEQIKAIKEYTQNAAYYTLFFDEVPEGEDAVLYFLNVAKKGKCWHYATAATMLYRAAGIPARFVTGYMVDIKGANAFTDVYSKNAHGWVEVYIQGVGWVQIEVTGSEPEEVTYDITIPTASATKYYGEVDVLTAETVDWTEFKKKNPTWEYEESSGKWICSGEGQEGHWFWQSDVENGFDEGLRNVGTKTNSTSFAIYDADGKSVSKQYKGYVTGRLELKPIEVTVRSESAEFNYVDGEGVWCTDFTVEKVNAGDSGYNSEVTNKDQLKQMIVIDFDYDENEPFMGDGNEQNTFTAYVAVNGERVDYYKVIYEYGTITVN